MLLKSVFQNKIFVNFIFYFCLVFSFFGFLFSFYANEEKINIPLFNGDNADIRLNIKTYGDTDVFINGLKARKTPNFPYNPYDFYESDNVPVYNIAFSNTPEKIIISAGGNLYYFTEKEISAFKKDEKERYIIPDYVKYDKNSKYITDKGILKKIFTFIMSVFYNSKFYIVPLILLLLSGFIYFKNKDKVNIEFKTFKKGAIFWILGFALILRLSDLSSFYWTDELYSVYEAGNVNFPFLKTFSDPGNPPLFFILARIYMLLFGVEPNVTRMLSVIFSVICIYAVYVFVKNNLNEDNKNKIALIVSFLYSINIYSICIAQEFRCYSLCALFSVLSAYLLFEIIKYKKNKDFVLYTFLSILMANTHYFQILILISNFIIAMIFLDNKSRIKFFISNFIAFLSFLPYFFMTALNNALLNEEFNKFLMPDINFYIDTFIKFIQGKTAFIIVMVLFFISLVPYLRKKIFEKDDKFLNLFWYSMYIILSLFVLSYLFSLVKPIAKMYYFTVILPFFVILFVLSCFILKKKSIAFLISFFMVCSLFSYSDYIQRDKSRLLDFKRIVKFYYCDSKYHNQKSALIVPHSKEMIKNAFPYYLDDDEIIVIKPPLSVEKLTEKIEKSKAENFYIKIEYNIFKNFFDIMPENYDYEIIRTDKDVIIARIMKRGASL